MPEQPAIAQLTGLDDTHLVTLSDGHRLQVPVARAFAELQAEARRAGFELAIASSYRSFFRQLAIFNDKVSGLRPVYDDAGQVVLMDRLTAPEQLHAVLRYSALPGGSRHHWGTDLDVYDAAAVSADYALQLSPAEVASGGVFDDLHRWLDERIATGRSSGFFRPYGVDRGGVAPERWHLSYAPLSSSYVNYLTCDALRACWDTLADGAELLLREEIEAHLPQILQRYVAVDPRWCRLP